MAIAKTEQELRDLIDLNLANNSNIQPIKHREVENALVDLVYDAELTGTFTDANGRYSLDYVFKRIGDFCHFSILLQNLSQNYIQLNAFFDTLLFVPDEKFKVKYATATAGVQFPGFQALPFMVIVTPPDLLYTGNGRVYSSDVIRGNAKCYITGTYLIDTNI